MKKQLGIAISPISLPCAWAPEGISHSVGPEETFTNLLVRQNYSLSVGKKSLEDTEGWEEEVAAGSLMSLSMSSSSVDPANWSSPTEDAPHTSVTSLQSPSHCSRQARNLRVIPGFPFSHSQPVSHHIW